MPKVTEFPLIKTVDSDEAMTIAKRIGAKQGVLLFECPCGCGRIKCMEVGEPDVRDLLFYAKNLENYAMEEYVAEVEDVSEDEIP
jgi:hypothetical protein